MSEKYDLEFNPGWIESIDKHECSIYSDTDSSYNLVKLPFNKFEDKHKTVDYSQEKAKEINKLFLNVLNTRHAELAGIDPDFNLMNFKSEVVAYRGFFRSKKYYALSKIWDEGNFFDTPKLKMTGGQIRKSDVTKITLNMLKDIYELLTMSFNIKDEKELCYKIFVEIKNKYEGILLNDIKNLNIESFSIPKKWGLKEFKNTPNQVIGSMIYNSIYQDTLRPGSSILMFHIKINSTKKLYDKISKNKNTSDYQISPELFKNIQSKLNYFCVPYGIQNNQDEMTKIFNILNEFNIELDIDEIISFNIHKKIIQFVDLFDESVFKSLNLKM